MYTFGLAPLIQTTFSGGIDFWLYAAFMLSFGIKVPIVPVHTWFPDTHTQAPTAGSVILAGLLLKTGTTPYSVLPFPLFPMAIKFSMPLLAGLGLAGLFYTAWIALSQTDMKRLVAYSSVGHMGLVILGLSIFNAVTIGGALLQMINHGISTSAFFILVGMLDERVHSRKLGRSRRTLETHAGFQCFFAFFRNVQPGVARPE